MLPVEEDAFTFAVFGDRTGGPADGVKVLAEAVRDANLVEPDLVMTVGDLVDRHCHRFGLMLRPLINMCIMSPPLIITRGQVDELVEALRRGLDCALEDLRAEGLWRD